LSETAKAKRNESDKHPSDVEMIEGFGDMLE